MSDTPAGITAELVLNSVYDAGLSAALEDIGEALLDTLFEDGSLLDAIPLVRTIRTAAMVPFSIQNRVFLKKLLRFIISQNGVDASWRQEQIDRITNGDASKRREFGEQLIITLDRLDSLNKPALYAAACLALLHNRIDLARFHRIGRAIDRMDLSSIPVLVAFNKDRNSQSGLPDDALFDLSVAGLVRINHGFGMAYLHADLGKDFEASVLPLYQSTPGP